MLACITFVAKLPQLPIDFLAPLQQFRDGFLSQFIRIALRTLQLIHPPAGDSFLFGIFAYTLPNNAIYVRSGVHVSAVSSAPSIFDPTTSGDDGTAALSSVRFTLNRAGSVELSIHDATTGALVLRRTMNDIASGAQSITWYGRNGEGILVAPGRYRLGVAGIDETGARSTVVYTMQRVYY